MFIGFFFCRVHSLEFSQSKAEGFHQEGKKSAKIGPNQQLQTDDSATIS